MAFIASNTAPIEHHSPTLKQLCDQIIEVMGESRLPTQDSVHLLDDVFTEIHDPERPLHTHYGITGARSGCPGPLCSRIASDKTRAYKRSQMVRLGHAPAMHVGGRRTEKEAFRAVDLTKIAAILVAHREIEPPVALIEALLVDRIEIPDTPKFRDAHHKWLSQNENVAYDEPLYRVWVHPGGLTYAP